MKYPYIVKVNGVYYEAGQEVPASKPVKTDETKEKITEEISDGAYTKTDINRMNKETLVEKAAEIGVEDAEELSGNVLKDKLIEYYNL